MELEALKTSWARLDKKMQHAAVFSQKLVETIIASRAMSTVHKIKGLYSSFYVILTMEVVLLIAILIGNPFDFIYDVQFVPYGLLLIGVITAFINLIHIHRGINRLSPAIRIDQYLKSIVSIYDHNKRFEKWFRIMFLSVGLLVPLSFLPTKIEKAGLTGALLDTFIMISISLILFAAAFKLGLFKNRYKDKLEKDLSDWEDLKGLANEIDQE